MSGHDKGELGWPRRGEHYTEKIFPAVHGTSSKGCAGSDRWSDAPDQPCQTGSNAKSGGMCICGQSLT